jgi:hypothetical protein
MVNTYTLGVVYGTDSEFKLQITSTLSGFFPSHSTTPIIPAQFRTRSLRYCNFPAREAVIIPEVPLMNLIYITYRSCFER